MNRWLIALFPLMLVACTDSTPDRDPSVTSEAEAPPAAGSAPAQPSQTADFDTGMNAGADAEVDTDAGANGKAETDETTRIVTEEIAYEVNGEPFIGYLAYDDSIEGKRPGVLVVHEWWGHNQYARWRAEQLARMGYTAFALDMYGAGKTAEHPDTAMKFMQEATKDPGQAKERFLKAKQLLESHETTDADKTAAIGYCFGGGVVLNMARAGVDLDGVASFHGSLAPTVEIKPEEVTAEVLVLHGGDDEMVPQEQVEAFKKEMDEADVDYEFISYPGAKHSFTNPQATDVGEKYDMPLAYDGSADEKSWEELREFLDSLWPNYQ